MFRRLALALAFSAALFAQNFALKSGDRVVFYGDSITDQRLYTIFTETFVHTRYPKLDVSFVHSGVGGDRVTGGWAGPIELRMKRDVEPYKPTVVTVMLGMNDGDYHPYEQATMDRYTKGYERLIQLLKQAAPGARVTLIEPSPYDEVTRPPIKHGGYNPSLVKMSEFVATLASREGYRLADFNAPMVQMLQKAYVEDFEIAQKILPDRVHPGASGHLIMAEQLWKAWNADGEVSSVLLPADGNVNIVGRLPFEKVKIEDLKLGETMSWTATEESLPMPVDMNDPAVDLALRSAGFNENFNNESLRVPGLKAGYWALRIDGQQIKVFTAEELAKGVNLATLQTPMWKQARAVQALVQKRSDTHNIRWRSIEVPLADDKLTQAGPAMAALDALDAELAQRIQAESQPKPHHFELVNVPAEAANIPAGFTPIFNGKDLTGWHVSETNHHGNSKGWTVENGVLTGAQDRPGHGGILVTDKSYKNYEIYLEVNPDWGCDGGLFLRSTEAGEAYQVMLDYLPEGSVGGVYGEALKDVTAFAAPGWQAHWKKGEWNTIRARIEGDIPHITVWMNGTQITNWTTWAIAGWKAANTASATSRFTNCKRQRHSFREPESVRSCAQKGTSYGMAFNRYRSP
jgi:lysophospholipase L1-like esterase